MPQFVSLSVFVAGAILAALIASAGMAGTVQLASRRPHGYLYLMFYAMVLMIALSTLLSVRDLTSNALSFSEPAPLARHPVLAAVQPLVSLLALTVSAERIINYWIKRDKSISAPPVLLLTFILFWLGTVASPALLGAHPYQSHDYVYSLVIGIAAVLATGTERDLAFKATRNALMVFMAAGLLLIPFKPELVLDTSYTQGLLPGVPRLAGLAAHAVSLGILAQLGLVCLLAYPYRHAWLNRLAWVIGLVVLFLAQSKSAWISFAVSLICFAALRHGPGFWRRFSDPLRPGFGILSLLMVMLLVLVTVLALMFGDVDARLSSFFNSSQGAQLVSLTGRDKIWAIAYDEWLRNPVFGYGPLIWEADFRISIGMPNASHAHNQFMDTLSRSGTVGAVALLLYGWVLMVMSVRHATASRGLTLVLFVALAMRAVSEVPLSLFGYGAELFTHLLLLMTLAVASGEAHVRKIQTASERIRRTAPPVRNSLVTARARSNP